MGSLYQMHCSAKYFADMQISCKIMLSHLTDLSFDRIDCHDISVQNNTAILMIDKSIIKLVDLPAGMAWKIEVETETKFGFNIEYLVEMLHKIKERSVS